LSTSGFESPFDAAAVEALLDRAKNRSAQLRRRRFLMFAGAPPRRTTRSDPPRTVERTPPPPPRRFSPSVMALGGGGVVVAVVIAIVLANVTGGGPLARLRSGAQPPASASATATVLSEITAVTPQEASAVSLDAEAIAPPSVTTGQPPLTIGGKPGVVFIGGEFCPYCAAERWPIIMAFSRFGTFSGLTEISSSPWDSDPSTATFSFHGATYSSPALTLDAVEYESNDTHGLGTRTILQPLSPLEAQVWKTYDNNPGFPFLDIGNKVLVLSPSFDPTYMAGLNQADIASKLSNPDDPLTQRIVGTANYITAAICSILGPSASAASPWCSQPVIMQAALAMGLP